MSDVAITVITPMANLEDAVALSVVNGQAQFTFSGRATTDPAGGGASPTHCMSSGWVDESLKTAYEQDSRFFVSTSSWRTALTQHNPALYRWIDPNPLP